MTELTITRGRLGLYGAAAALAAAAIGYGVAQLADDGPPAAAAPERKILYWYDPMIPAEHHDGPGLSSMGMKLVPKYAGEGGATAAPGVSIDAAGIQRLGARIAPVERGTLSQGVTATGTVEFDERDVAVVQARSAAFVRRVYARAPGDVVPAGAPLADVLAPEWAGARAEYDAIRKAGDPALARAARQRMTLLGMEGRGSGYATIRTPIGGVIRTLAVRQGMTLAPGQTLAEVNGLGSVWLNTAVPEAAAGQVRVGQTATATLAAFPGETFTGRVAAILPQAAAASRTLTVRIVLPNRGGRLRPGMFAAVDLGSSGREALVVPSEAVIRTGRRTLVMLAQPNRRFRPAEVRVGADGGGKTEILAGLAAGEKVVASGQFLIDSEASLAGIDARPIGGAPAQAKPAAAPVPPDTTGRIGGGL